MFFQLKAGWKKKKQGQEQRGLQSEAYKRHTAMTYSLQLGLKSSFPDVHSTKGSNLVSSQHWKDKTKYPRDFLSCFWRQDQIWLYP